MNRNGVLVVTLWTGSPGSCLAAQSAKRHGIEVLTPREAPWWDNWPHGKLEVLCRALCGSGLDHDVVLYVDADDVLFTSPRSVDMALAALRSSGAGMLLGAEFHFEGAMPVVDTFRANAGVWIADRHVLEDFFVPRLKAKSKNWPEAGIQDPWIKQNFDQHLYREAVALGVAKLDVQCQLSLNLDRLGPGLSASQATLEALRAREATLHGCRAAKGRVLEAHQNLLDLDELAMVKRFPDPSTPSSVNSTQGLVELLTFLYPRRLDHVVEIGSYAGVSTAVLAILCGRVTSVDPWAGASAAGLPGYLHRITPWRRKIRTLHRNEGSLVGVAVSLPHEEDGQSLWCLQTFTAIRGGFAQCMFFIQSRRDLPWAIEVWKSLKH